MVKHQDKDRVSSKAWKNAEFDENLALIKAALFGNIEVVNLLLALKGACSSFIMSSRLLISLTKLFFDGSMRPVAFVNGLAVGLTLFLYFKLQKLQQNNRDVLEVSF